MNPVHAERVVLLWYELGFELLVEGRGFGRRIGRHTKLVEPHAVT